MEETSGRNRRKLKNYLIDPKVQVIMYLPFIFTLVVFVVTDHLIVHRALDEISRLTPDPNAQALEALNSTYENLVRTSILGLVLAAGLGFVLVTIVSHRLLGPLYNIQRFVRRLREGTFQGKVVLRKGDMLTQLADDLNTLSEKLIASGEVRTVDRE